MRFILITIHLVVVQSHSRLFFPRPDDDAGNSIANGALTTENCGHSPPLSWGSASTTTFSPGIKKQLTFTFQSQRISFFIYHAGYSTIQIQELVSRNGPYRICLLDSNEICRLVLLDHIPQSTAGPINYFVNVYLPDVKCDSNEKCKLQLLWIQTGGTECKYYDRDPKVQVSLPTNVIPPACTSVCT